MFHRWVQESVRIKWRQNKRRPNTTVAGERRWQTLETGFDYLVWVQQRRAERRRRQKQDGGGLQQTARSGDKRNRKAPGVTCSGLWGAEYHDDTKCLSGGTGRVEHRQANQGAARTMEWLPYCSDKGMGRGWGGGTRGRHTCCSSHCNKLQTETRVSHLQQHLTRQSGGISGLGESVSEMAAQPSGKRQTKQDMKLTLTRWHMLHTHIADVFIHAFRHEAQKIRAPS